MGTSSLQSPFVCEPAHARLGVGHGGDWFALSMAGRGRCSPEREIFEHEVLKSQLDMGTVSP